MGAAASGQPASLFAEPVIARRVLPPMCGRLSDVARSAMQPFVHNDPRRHVIFVDLLHRELRPKCSISVFKCSISGIKCSISVIKCSISVIRCSISMSKCSILGFKCSISVIKSSILVFKCSIYVVKCSILVFTCSIWGFKY